MKQPTTFSSEVGIRLPVANSSNALVQGNLAFRFDVRENAAQDWGSSRTYDIEVLDGETSLGTIGITNSTDDDAGNPEGITVSYDLTSTSTVPDLLTIRVDRTAN